MDYVLSKNLTPEEIIAFRESLVCNNCGSTSRDRMMMWSFANTFLQKSRLQDLPINKNVKILETSAQRGHPQILLSKFDYLNTEYDPVAITDNRDPRKYADLQNLHFENESFDFVLTSDVFEHVRLDDKAFSEIYRILKPSGYFIMTVPFSYAMKDTLVRVRPEGDKDIFLLPPEYHAANTLVYRVYGKDLFEKLNSLGFHVCYLHVQVPSLAISNQDVFICGKNDYPNTTFLNRDDVMILNEEIFH